MGVEAKNRKVLAMADSIIMERVADAAAECFYAELVKTEDLGVGLRGPGRRRERRRRGLREDSRACRLCGEPRIRNPPARARARNDRGHQRPHQRRKAQRPGQVVVAQGRGGDMPHQVRAGNGTAARRAGRIPVVHRKAGECGRVGCGEAGQAHARDVGKGLGAAASGAAAGEVRDDIPISKELGSCYR